MSGQILWTVKVKFLQELTFPQETWRQKQLPGASPGEGQQDSVAQTTVLSMNEKRENFASPVLNYKTCNQTGQVLSQYVEENI